MNNLDALSNEELDRIYEDKLRILKDRLKNDKVLRRKVEKTMCSIYECSLCGEKAEYYVGQFSFGLYFMCRTCYFYLIERGEEAYLDKLWSWIRVHNRTPSFLYAKEGVFLIGEKDRE